MTYAQKCALTWFCERGGNGLLDKHGRVVARGEYSTLSDSTWLQLIGVGMVSGCDGKIWLTHLGHQTVKGFLE